MVFAKMDLSVRIGLELQVGFGDFLVVYRSLGRGIATFDVADLGIICILG
jgi:hypothetical protein